MAGAVKDLIQQGAVGDALYVRAYNGQERMRAGLEYFKSFQTTAKDFAELSETKLAIPVLSVGGDKSLGVYLGQQMKLVAPDVTVVVIKDAGHWVMEEKPAETTDALIKFL